MENTFFPRGITFLNAAVAQDKAQNYNEALKLYIRSLEFFLTGLKYSKNERTNAIVRVKTKDYMAKAERIRAALNATSPETRQKTATSSSLPSSSQQTPAPTAQGKATGRLATRQPDEALRTALGDALLHEKPNLTWDDLAGLDQARKTLEEAVLLPQKFPQLFKGERKAWKGILLYGPPGTGKSYLAKIIASVSSASFFTVSSADLVSKYFGQSEKLMRELFVMAVEKRPAIIFIDEIDAICGKRSDSQQESSQRMLTEFLTCMTDITDTEGVLVMAATNRPFDLDPAVRRRFEKRIYIPLPNHEARLSLFKIHSGCGTTESSASDHKKHSGGRLSEREFAQLAHLADGFSGSDIESACRDALMQPVRDCLRAKYWRQVEDEGDNGRVSIRYTPCVVSTGDGDDAANQIPAGAQRLDMMQLTPETLAVPDVSLDHFERTLASVKASVGHDELRMYEDFTRMFGMEGNATADDEVNDQQLQQEQRTRDKGKDKLVEMELQPSPSSSSSSEPRSKKRRSGGGAPSVRQPVVAM